MTGRFDSHAQSQAIACSSSLLIQQSATEQASTTLSLSSQSATFANYPSKKLTPQNSDITLRKDENSPNQKLSSSCTYSTSDPPSGAVHCSNSCSWQPVDKTQLQSHLLQHQMTPSDHRPAQYTTSFANQHDSLLFRYQIQQASPAQQCDLSIHPCERNSCDIADLQNPPSNSASAVATVVAEYPPHHAQHGLPVASPPLETSRRDRVPTEESSKSIYYPIDGRKRSSAPSHHLQSCLTNQSNLTGQMHNIPDTAPRIAHGRIAAEPAAIRISHPHPSNKPNPRAHRRPPIHSHDNYLSLVLNSNDSLARSTSSTIPRHKDMPPVTEILPPATPMNPKTVPRFVSSCSTDPITSSPPGENVFCSAGQPISHAPHPDYQAFMAYTNSVSHTNVVSSHNIYPETASSPCFRTSHFPRSLHEVSMLPEKRAKSNSGTIMLPSALSLLSGRAPALAPIAELLKNRDSRQTSCLVEHRRAADPASEPTGSSNGIQRNISFPDASLPHQKRSTNTFTDTVNGPCENVAQGPESMFGCHICGRGFISESALQIHQRLQHGLVQDPQPWRCATCGMRFGRKSSLSRHQLSRHQQKRFGCRVCSKSYSQKFDAVKHERKAHGFHR